MRLNIFSDIPWEKLCPGLFSFFHDVQFYDYTKLEGRKPPKNYDLTFSYSGHNLAESKAELKRGHRAAVVFGVRPARGNRPADPLPDRFWGKPVVDGDLHDLRPLDPSGVVVGLRWKPPFGWKHQPPTRREMPGFHIFVVACSIIEGKCVVTETPRYTNHPEE